MAIRKRKNKGGSFVYFAAVYNRDTGKYVYGKAKKLKRDAIADEASIKNELANGNFIQESNLTVDEGFNLWIKSRKSDNLSSNTIYNYQSLYNKHLKSEFGMYKLKTIKPFQIQEYWSKLLLQYSTSTVIKLHNILNGIYKMNVRLGNLRRNIMDSVKRPTAEYSEIDIWSLEEANTFLYHAQSYQSFLVFWMAIQTGMRSSEIRGLTWDCIDFQNNIITVKQQYNERQNRIVHYTKTKSSNREILISDDQKEVLLNHLKNQKIKTDIVCASKNGRFLSASNVRRTKKRICEIAGIKNIKLHEMRHTHATMLVELEEPIKYISERLGHSNTKITLDTYVHTNRKRHRKTADVFSNYFNN